MILLIETEGGQEIAVNVRRIEEKRTSLGARTVITPYADGEGMEPSPIGDIDLNRERVRLLPNG